MSRTKRQKQEHQGALTKSDGNLVSAMKRLSLLYFTSGTICKITGCVSARDKIRKLQAAGIKIGPAKLLRVNDNGSRVYGWRMK